MKINLPPETNDINKLFNCPVPLFFEDLSETGTVGHYEPIEDRMVLCTTLEKQFPFHRSIVYLHEMFHATGGASRSFRSDRLKKVFGRKKYRVEECIAEVCTMVAMKKLGIFGQYARVIPETGLNAHYDTDIFIPWREVVSAMEKFKLEGVDFSQDLAFIREYLTDHLKITVKEHYEGLNN